MLNYDKFTCWKKMSEYRKFILLNSNKLFMYYKLYNVQKFAHPETRLFWYLLIMETGDFFLPVVHLWSHPHRNTVITQLKKQLQPNITFIMRRTSLVNYRRLGQATIASVTEWC